MCASSWLTMGVSSTLLSSVCLERQLAPILLTQHRPSCREYGWFPCSELAVKKTKNGSTLRKKENEDNGSVTENLSQYSWSFLQLMKRTEEGKWRLTSFFPEHLQTKNFSSLMTKRIDRSRFQRAFSSLVFSFLLKIMTFHLTKMNELFIWNRYVTEVLLCFLLFHSTWYYSIDISSAIRRRLSILIILTLYVNCIASIRLHIVPSSERNKKWTRCCLYYIHVNEVNWMTLWRVIVGTALREMMTMMMMMRKNAILAPRKSMHLCAHELLIRLFLINFLFLFRVRVKLFNVVYIKWIDSDQTSNGDNVEERD